MKLTTALETEKYLAAALLLCYGVTLAALITHHQWRCAKEGWKYYCHTRHLRSDDLMHIYYII